MEYELIAVWPNGHETLVSWSADEVTINRRRERYQADACFGVVCEVRANDQ